MRLLVPLDVHISFLVDLLSPPWPGRGHSGGVFGHGQIAAVPLEQILFINRKINFFFKGVLFYLLLNMFFIWEKLRNSSLFSQNCSHFNNVSLINCFQKNFAAKLTDDFILMSDKNKRPSF